jgi:ribosomal protein S18 acetylase RimI-like enzyme
VEPQDIKFHRASLEDLDALMPLLARLRTDDPTLCGAPFDAPAARAAVARLIESEHAGRVWLIRTGDETIGYLVLTFSYSLEFGGRTALIDELWISPDHRGRGIGSQALAFAEREARAADARGLFLEVSPDNAGAERLYARAGFAGREFRLMYKRL